MKKNLIIRPRCGLTNQLTCIAKGIIFAHLTNRNIYIDNFQVDYRDYTNFIKINEIININKLQNTINNLNINVTILDNIIDDIKKINTFSNDKIYFLKDNIISIIQHPDNDYIINLDIDNPISCNIPHEYENKLFEIMTDIDFVDELKETSEKIIKKLNLNNYSCIHLRLENDAIKYMYQQCNILDYNNINTIYKAKYLLELPFFKNNTNNCYICTSLCPDDDNYKFYDDLKIKFKLKDKNDIIQEWNDNVKYDLKSSREILGIIDYIIAKNSSFFLGCDWSGFSLYINSHLKKNNKYTKLIDIWSSIKYLK